LQTKQIRSATRGGHRGLGLRFGCLTLLILARPTTPTGATLAI